MLLILTFSSESDRDKFEYLYERYKRLLLHKAYDILKDYSLSEDAVSEAYIRIYKNLHKIDDPAANKCIAFLVTITKNVALTMLAREKGALSDEYDESQPDDFNLEENVISALSSEEIYTVMNRLSEELRSVFLLKYAYGYSHKEIGRLLDISENNVTVRLHRAKKKLHELLVKEGLA